MMRHFFTKSQVMHMSALERLSAFLNPESPFGRLPDAKGDPFSLFSCLLTNRPSPLRQGSQIRATFRELKKRLEPDPSSLEVEGP